MGREVSPAGSRCLLRVHPRGAARPCCSDKYQFQFWAVRKLGATALGGVTTFPERAGPDLPDTRRFAQVIIFVKGSGPALAMCATSEASSSARRRPSAGSSPAMCPTREMTKEANEAGLHTSPWDGKKFPRIQIITAGGIVHG